MAAFRIAIFFAVISFNAVSGIVSTELIHSMEYPFRLIGIAGDVLILGLALLALYRNRNYYGVKLFALFVVCSLLTVVYNMDRMGIVPQLNGLRQPLFFFSNLIVLHDIAMSDRWEKFQRTFTIFLIGLAILQIPISVWQFLKYGAGDPVGGTYGLTGGSGLVSQLAFLTMFYLSVRFGSTPDGSSFLSRKVLLFCALLIPCALNETKVSFVLLPTALVLLALSRKHWYRGIPIAAAGAVLLVLLKVYYTETAGDSDKVLTVNFFEKYLYSDTEEKDLPRFARIPLMFRTMNYEPVTIALGMGWGLFMGSNILGETRLGKSLFWLTGSRMLFFSSWIQGGFLAFLLMGFGTFWFARSPFITYFTLRRMRLFLLASIAISWMYNDAVFDRLFAPVLTYLMVWTESGGNALDHESEESSETTVTTSEAGQALS